MNFLKFLRYLLIISLFFSTTTGCKKIDWDGDFEPDGKKRARKNVEEGKGFGVSNVFGAKKGGVFYFASLNDMGALLINSDKTLSKNLITSSINILSSFHSS